MELFISWSGQQSKKIAEILANWIHMVVQASNPWISNDIAKGVRWNPEISEKLSRSKMGIFCLTQENLHSDWILFEAGAISKFKENYVCTFLYDLKPADIQEPLAQFQHTIFSKEDVKKLIDTINKATDKPLDDITMAAIFDKNWPDLEKSLNSIPSNGKKTTPKAERSDRELLEEILELTRRLSNNPIYDSISQSVTISKNQNELFQDSFSVTELNKEKRIKEATLKYLINTYPQLNKFYKQYQKLINDQKEPKVLALDQTFRDISAINTTNQIPLKDLQLFLDVI